MSGEWSRLREARARGESTSEAAPRYDAAVSSPSTPSSNSPENSGAPWIGLGMAIGSGLGAALGAASGKLAVWLPIGIAIGLAMGVAISRRRRA